MALIKCPECGGKVSDKANVCIHCGFSLIEEDPIDTLDEMFEIDEKLNKIVNYNNNENLGFMNACLPVFW